MKTTYLDNIESFVFPDFNPSVSTYIYFIMCMTSKNNRVKNRIKIGITKKVNQRLAMLQIGNPFPLNLLYKFKVPKEKAPRIEQELHKKFRWNKERGEWFKNYPCIENWIEAHKTATKTIGQNRSKKYILRKRQPDSLPTII